MFFKNSYKKITSILLIFTMVVTLVPESIVNAEGNENPYPYTIFAGSDEEGAITFEASNVCVNGNVCTNGTVDSKNRPNINGSIDEYAKEEMPYLWDWLEENDKCNDELYSDDDITIEKNIRLSNGDVLASQKGNIIIAADEVDLNGLVYAPNGCVEITAKNLNMNSVLIIADTVVIHCPNVNANYNSELAKQIKWTYYGHGTEQDTEQTTEQSTEQTTEQNTEQTTEQNTEQGTETKHEVKFVIGGVATEEIPSQYVEDGEYAVEPEEPEADGYLFLGWCSGEELKNCFEFKETPIEKDTTLYAYWYNENDKTDTDGDSFEDEYEKLLGLNPESNDTDGDGLSDYDELYYELNADPCVFDTDDNGILDGDEDFDEDGLMNKEEFDMETAPDCADTDDDGLMDGEEVYKYKTNPLKADTDGDNATDGKEIELGTDPLVFNNSFDLKAEFNKGDIEAADITMSVEVDSVSGEQIESFDLQPVVNDALFPTSIPGYMGCAYNISMSGHFDEATLTFTYDVSDYDYDELDPVIYYFNEEEQRLEELETTVNGNRASAKTPHFSTYILINRVIYEKSREWVDTWDIENGVVDDKYDGVEMILVIDDSTSMQKNDPYNKRLTVAKSLINSMPSGSKAAITKFETLYETLVYMTDDKGRLVNSLNTTNFVSKSKGDGEMGLHGPVGETSDMYFTLNGVFPEFSGSVSDNTKKVIVLITDGIATDSENSGTVGAVYGTAERNNISIYTIGLGDNEKKNFEDTLIPLSDATGGLFYNVDDEIQLNRIFDNMLKKKTSVIDLELDSDHDGISDYYEEHLPRFNGVKMNLDKYNPDTDADGLKDGEEIASIEYVYNSDKTKVTVYGRMKSDPTAKDSDDDGLLDNEPIKDSKGEIIAPKDNKPLWPNEYYNMWKEYIKEMQTGTIATGYASKGSQELLVEILEKLPEEQDKKYVKEKMTEFLESTRKFVINNEEEADSWLLENEEEIQRVAMYVKEKCTGETAAKVGACILNFVQDDCQQGYHSLPETWQKNYGYTKLYDDVFRVGSNMDVYPSEAIVDGKKYVLWLWKGDYWNLGTGAEIGLYTTAKESTSSNPADANAHFDAVDFNLPMQLSLFQYPGTQNRRTYFNWKPSAPQWWITGFNSQCYDPDPKLLLSVGKIDFSSHPEMGKEFQNALLATGPVNDAIYSDGYLWILWR